MKTRSRFLRTLVVGVVSCLVGSAALAQAEAPPADEPAAPESGEASTPPAEEPTAPHGVEEMVVTITKREEAVQDIPASITAFDAEQLEDANLQSISDIANLLPNVQIKGEGNEAISIRGISQSFTSSSPVAQHMNGVFHYRGGSYQNMFYDLQSVEVVRGPSGTVYGRNATAGAIDLRWHEPTDELEVFGDSTVGNYDLYQFRGGVNVPILPDELLMGRFAFQTVERDGYQDNLVESSDKQDPTNANDVMARGFLLSRPTEDLELQLRGYYTDTYGSYSASHPFVDEYPVGQFDFGDPNDPLQPGLGVYPFDAYNGLQDFLTAFTAPGTTSRLLTNFHNFLIAGYGPYCGRPGALPTCKTPEAVAQEILTQGSPIGFPAIFHPRAFALQPQQVPGKPEEVRSAVHTVHELGLSTLWGVDGEVDWNLGNLGGMGDVRMALLGGFERDRERTTSDADGSTLFLLDTAGYARRSTQTGELRFLSQGWEKLNWLAGFFWFERKEDFYQESLLPFGDIALCGDCPFITERLQKDQGYAPFVNLSFTPIEEIEITLGGRLNHDDVYRDSFQPPTPPRGCSQFEDTVTFREATYELGAKYFVTEDHLIYAKGGKGYKAGGWNDDVDTIDPTLGPDGCPLLQEGVSYAPEIVWASEVGTKNTLFDGRLNLNLTGFWYKYKDLQVPQIRAIQVFTLNAAEATVWGIELEAQAQPTDEWTIGFAGGHLNATFDDFCADDSINFSPLHDPGCTPDGPPQYAPFGGRADLEGNTLEDSPKWKAAIFTSYDISLGELGSLRPVLEFTWTDDYYLRPFNLEIDRVDSYTKTDLRLIWTDLDERYTVELFGENLENEYVYARAIVGPEFTGGMAAGFGLLPPRTFGVRIGFNWYGGN